MSIIIIIKIISMHETRMEMQKSIHTMIVLLYIAMLYVVP